MNRKKGVPSSDAVRTLLGPSLGALITRAEQMAFDCPRVVLIGPEGVGKSLLAAHIHAWGIYQNVPMLSLNIATSGDRHQRLSLLGADFSHLTSSKRSVLEHPTTVVIKHIDKAPIALQEVFAQCLSSGSISRPGSIRTKPVRSRLVFTFRKPIRELEGEATLEKHLASLLMAAPSIHLPSLAERTADLRIIARACYGRRVPPSVEKVLLVHSWPGNLAELRSTIECLKPFRSEGRLPDLCRRELSAMLLRIKEGREFSLRQSLSVIERGMIYQALKRTDGHRARAAQLLGLTDTALRWHIERIRDVA